MTPPSPPRPEFDRLSDLTRATLATMSSIEVRALIEVARAQDRRTGSRPRRIAMVVARDVDYGIVRMFQTGGDDRRPEQRVFRSFAEAEQWLAGQGDAPGG